MKPILTQLFAGIFLLLASQAFGQAPNVTTSFVITSPAAPSPYSIGTHIVIELRVNGFTNVESMQFPITYNKDALKFDSLTNSAFSNWNAGNYVSVPASGKIGVSWDGYSGGANMPFSFPNGTALFKLHFTATSNGISTVNISAAAAPPALDVVGNGVPGVINYQSGGTPTFTLGSGFTPPPLVGFKIIANTIYIPQGERGCMPVTVNDFDSIVSMQWAMHWDNTVLSFECTRAYNLDGWSAGDFNSIYAPGRLLAGWSDPSGVGKTRADGVRIVDVCFKAIGAPGANTTVTIDGVGFPPGNGTAEAYNAKSVNVWTLANNPKGESGISAPINIIVVPQSNFDVTYSVDTVSAAQTTQACVAVKVKNFTAVTSSEFALSYNPTELTYLNTSFGANPLNLQASNITHVLNPGVIKFVWANASGATVANDAAIFTSCFTVIAPAPTQSNISFTTTPCPTQGCMVCTTITGMGTAKAGGGVSMARYNGWIKSAVLGPTLVVVSQVSCFGGNNGSINLSNPPSTTATNYAWAGPGINAGNQGMEDPTGLTAGTYTVTVTYSVGGTQTKSATIIQPTALAQTNSVNTVSCFGGSNGAINLTPTGGTAPYTYLWSNGSTVQDPAGLPVAIYTLNLKDANNCVLPPVDITVSGFAEMKLASTAVTDVTCSGLSTGAIEIAVSLGAGGYTYKWSNNSTTKNLTNMPAGSYSVTVTDLNGCTKAFSNLTIGSPTPLTASLVSKTDVKCAGSPTGTADITIAGGTGAKTVCWSTGNGPCASNMVDPTNLPSGNYTTVITDANGCTTTIANVVIAPPTNGVIAVTGTGTSALCFGQNTGSINLNVSGGWGNYTYLWDNTNPSLPDPPPIKDPVNVPPSLYVVTVTDGGQCTATQSVTVNGPQTDITEATVIQPVKCFNANDGSIDLNLAGGNGSPYNVTWSNTTLNGEAIGPLAPGTYQPTVSDNKGCTKVLSAVTITGPQVLQIDTTITAASPNNGTIILTITSGGTPGFTYLWSNGATTKDLSGLTVGTYTVTITDANACVRSFPFSVPNGNVLIGATYTTQGSCNQDGAINLFIPVTAALQAPFTITWGGAGATMQTNSLTPSITGLPSNVYSVTVTASNTNFIVIAPIAVNQLDPASVNSNTTNPFSGLLKNGKITLTPALGTVCPLTYQWGPLPLNSTSHEVSGLGQGTYYVTITNSCSGCTSVQEFPLVYSPLVIAINGAGGLVQPDCSNSATGLINITVQGGNPPYTYVWSGPNGLTETTEDIADLNSGVYNVVATDQDGRTATNVFTLTTQSNLNITNVNETSLYGPFQVSGYGICDGIAAVVFTPGFGTSNIVWSNGVTGINNTALCGGPYSVTVTDAAGCTSVWTDDLSTPSALAANQQSDGVKCHSDCNGDAKVIPSGGVGPYTVMWPSGQSEPVSAGGFSKAVNLCGGDYEVTVTDNNGIEALITVNVPQPPEIVVNFSPTAPRNFNACDGDMLAQVSGAVLPITYYWYSDLRGDTSSFERYENRCSGEVVFLSITDANGCALNASDTIPYPEDGCFRVSPIITPGQQDGNNDYVKITCIETALKSHIEIYNRWGQLVFLTKEGESYSNDAQGDPEHNWNGLNNTGQALAEGVYYYVLTYTFINDIGEEKDGTTKGAINLLR